MGSRRDRLGHFRRTVVTGICVLGAVTVVAAARAPAAVGAPGQAAEGFNKGTGSAFAQSIRVDPVAGGLSFGVGVGESLAGHQNSAATAESRSANLGVIGTTLAGEGCDGGDPTLPAERQPGSLRVESSEEGAAEGKSGQDPNVPGVDRQVRATTDPFAEAITSGSNLDVPGAVSVQGTRSTASSGVEGELREAIARTEIGRIALAAGVVEMRDLVWEAVNRTGSADEQLATFSIGSMTIGGVPVPVDDPTQALAEANEALAVVGLQIRPPRAHFDETPRGTLATVDPLAVRVVPAPARDGVTAAVLGGAQPVREDLFTALTEADCGSFAFITVLDVVLSAFGAGGYFAVELGGVQASTNEITRFGGLGGAGGNLPSLEGNLPASGTASGTLGGSTSSGSTSGSTSGATPAAPAAAPAGASQPIEDAVETAADAPGSRGGAMAAVAAGGLLLLAGVAEGDRRKMRRAQREIPLEA